ncbi:glycosyltransferase family 1 protein [Sphingomonas piscis]|uniref:Glycosyltransferase family 1 protein n=1 Tax=Sphingomonas piscis TaxID=2714943 RepID=A0A6G7YR29_9SPHN|nr:glycosyltransferase family 1 protein [Sphingomonas piscis]QIK79192.1 glycosyltransferase family 1 protein [Sphingomonas piscis]
MDPTELRIALFSGNYNYVRDGANQSLNRLVGYLLKVGAQVRVYAPTVPEPAFEPTGDLISVPSVAIPFRPEYRLALGLPGRIRRDVQEFDPNIVQVCSPDIASHRALTWARRRGIATVGSVHTRFDTYLEYYHLEAFEPTVRAIMRRFYGRCDALLAPAESMAAVLRAQRMNKDIAIWSRGIDHAQFNPGRRDLAWRRGLGVADEEFVVGFLGRIVMEKGLDVFTAAVRTLADRGVPHRVLVIGEGPARPWMQQQLPEAIFLGEQVKDDLARALASADVLLNPSITETFGNVTLEAMACGLPVIAAAATGTTSLVKDNENGILVEPGDTEAMAEALEAYAREPELRARHGEAGLKLASVRDWDTINSAVLRVYDRVIRKRARLERVKGR